MNQVYGARHASLVRYFHLRSVFAGLVILLLGIFTLSQTDRRVVNADTEGSNVVTGTTPTTTPTEIMTPTPCMSPGSLDTSFGSGGKVVTSIGSFDDEAHSVAIQSDGKIVATGIAYTAPNFSNSAFALVRYNPNGTLDTTFGGTGKVVTPIGTSTDGASSVAIQTDGRIVAAGFSSSGSRDNFALVRYNLNGTLDTTFGGTGKVVTPIGTNSEGAISVAIQTDGKIVAAGDSYDGSNYAFALVRYNANGSLDATFNGGGIVVTSIRSDASAYSVAIQTDGRIVAAGYSYSSNTLKTDFALVRYNTNGTIDTTFGGSGRVITPIGSGNDVPYSVAIQTDGRIVAAGKSSIGSNEHFALVRYNINGTLDTTFNGGGIVVTPIGNTYDDADAVAIQTDGRIVATGYSSGSPHDNFTLVRYNISGTLDTTFNGTGKVVTAIGSGSARASSVAIQPDGGIVAVGYSNNGSDEDFAVVRYNGAACGALTATPTPTATTTNSPTNTPTATPTGTPARRAAFDYDGDRKSDISVFRTSNGAWYLQESQAGFFGMLFGVETDKIAPADYDGDGKTDVAVYRPSTGVWYVFNSSNGTVSYYVFGLADDLPTPADYDGDGKADISVFRPSTGTWYRQNSSDGSFFGVQFGASEDKPTVGDFDGDGKADIAVFRPSSGAWYRINSGNGSIYGELFGFGSDVITPADYDGDGKTDLAVYRPSTGIWYLKYSLNSAYDYKVFGLSNDIPTPADFDGDGKADICVFRPSDGNWYRQNSSNGAFIAFQFGANGDKPTQTAFRY